MIPSEQTQTLRRQYYQATLVSRRLVHEALAILRVRPDAPVHAHRGGQYTTLGLGMPLDPEHMHAFLCGNPKMIGVPVYDKLTKMKTYPMPAGLVQVLEERGFTADSKALKVKGHVHFEEYW